MPNNGPFTRLTTSFTGHILLRIKYISIQDKHSSTVCTKSFQVIVFFLCDIFWWPNIIRSKALLPFFVNIKPWSASSSYIVISELGLTLLISLRSFNIENTYGNDGYHDALTGTDNKFRSVVTFLPTGMLLCSL